MTILLCFWVKTRLLVEPNNQQVSARILELALNSIDIELKRLSFQLGYLLQVDHIIWREHQGTAATLDAGTRRCRAGTPARRHIAAAAPAPRLHWNNIRQAGGNG